MYFNFLDFGLLNELCERGFVEFLFELKLRAVCLSFLAQ